MSKIIAIDSSGLFFPAVFNFERMFLKQQETKEKMYILSPVEVYFSSLISCLKKIGVDKDTKVIIALEGKSWRKNYYAPYKAQREGAREEHKAINWNEEFASLNKLHELLDKATDWHFIRDWNSECDDIISVACRYYKDDEVIVVSGDGDLKMLAHYNNVNFFSIYKKCKSSRGMFEDIPNPLKILADKARKGDVSDNIIPSPNDTNEDFELRYLIVNLLELPNEIEVTISNKFKNLSNKELNLNKLSEKQRERFMQIYDKQYQITPEYCYKLQQKRENRKLKNKKGIK
jgi:hypothetical protein